MKWTEDIFAWAYEAIEDCHKNGLISEEERFALSGTCSPLDEKNNE